MRSIRLAVAAFALLLTAACSDLPTQAAPGTAPKAPVAARQTDPTRLTATTTEGATCTTSPDGETCTADGSTKEDSCRGVLFGGGLRQTCPQQQP